MRHSLIAVAAAAALLAACGKDPAPIIQPGVPVAQGQVMVQPQDPQQPQYQQPQYQPQVAQQPPVYQQPAVIAAPQPTVIVQQQPTHDSTGALVTGMALGALMTSGSNNTTVYRDRYVSPPSTYYEPAYRREARPANVTTNVTVQAPVAPQPQRTNLGSATLPTVRPGTVAAAPVQPVKVAPAPAAPAKVAPPATLPAARSAPPAVKPAAPATPPATRPSTSTSTSKK